MVQCILHFEEGIENELLSALTHITLQHWPKAIIALQSSIDYWKMDGYKKIIFGITHFPIITVQNFINAFPIDWEYRDNMVFNVHLQLRHRQESAVWSQLCSPDEIFLLPIVEWAHIYTWVE